MKKRNVNFQKGDRVRVRSEDAQHGGKHGVVEGVGNQLGYRVVMVKLDGVNSVINFAPNEVLPA